MVQKVLMIVGPTAVGKTTLSIKLAKHYDGEVVSADSMQVYQKLDIGTAKVTATEMEGVKHYLLDELPMSQRFSVADFINKSKEAINQIAQKGDLPILVGGTGFYLQSLVDNYHFGNDNYQDDQIRDQLHEYALHYGKQALWNKLNTIDPHAAQKIPQGNERRVIRALEVYQKTGKLFSQQHDQINTEYDFLIIGLNTKREILYQRINKRVDQMVAAGLLEEAHDVFDHGGFKLPAGKGIGYKEFYSYFEGKESLEDCIAQVKQNSRHYAKRQLTWFRNKMNVHWFDLVTDFDNEYPQILHLVEQWLTKA